MSVTDFGADRAAGVLAGTDPVFYAMSTALSRSGPTTGRPVLPPNGIASATAAVQAAWAALVAYYHRLRYGTGDYIDFSRFEAVVQSLDPPFGSEGQAAVGQKTFQRAVARQTPKPADLPDIRVSGRSRQGLPAVATAMARDAIVAGGTDAVSGSEVRHDRRAVRRIPRDQRADRRVCSPRSTMDELVTAGQSRGVPIAAVLSPAETLRLRALPVGRRADRQPPIAPGVDVTVPVRRVCRRRAPRGLRATRAPRWTCTKRLERNTIRRVRTDRTPRHASRPFDGLRILDLGVIVAGGELGRLFADLGAEVIKIESATYPDGLRQTPPGQVMSRSWALTHRNEYGLGLDLRSSRRRRHLLPPGRRRRCGLRQLQAGNPCIAGLFV